MSDSKTNGQLPFSLERALPDSAVCSTAPIGNLSGFGACQVEHPTECKYVIYFGEGNICRHPCWRDFLEKKD